MLSRLRGFFSRSKRLVIPFDHPELGRFEFVPKLGWEKSLDFDGHQILVQLGSDGEVPNQSMLDCLQYWLDNWATRRSEINKYITQQGASCSRTILHREQKIWS